MSTCTAAISTLIICFTSLTGSAQVREIGGVGLTIFSERSFRGQSATLREDVANFQSIGLNDRVSSLRVGPGERWEVCEHADYRGRCVVVSGSEPHLGTSGWNNIISSARRIDGQGEAGGSPGSQGLELFSGESFGGNRRRFTHAEPDLRRVSFNDVARSLRIGWYDVWEVCLHVNFVDCTVIDSNVRDLDRLGMSRGISSVRPLRSGRGGRGR